MKLFLIKYRLIYVTFAETKILKTYENYCNVCGRITPKKVYRLFYSTIFYGICISKDIVVWRTRIAMIWWWYEIHEPCILVLTMSIVPGISCSFCGILWHLVRAYVMCRCCCIANIRVDSLCFDAQARFGQTVVCKPHLEIGSVLKKA